MRGTPLIHKCTGFHTVDEGNPGPYAAEFSHDCACGIGHDHTVAEYWAFDRERDDD